MAKNGRKALPLVEIEWLDAITYSAYREFEVIEKQCPLATRHTSGYLLHEKTDDGRTIVVHTVDDVTASEPEPGGCDVTVIPAGWVKRIKYVRRPRGQKRKAKADTAPAGADNTTGDAKVGGT